MAGSFAKIAGHGAVLDTRVLDKITAELRPKASRIVQTFGFAISGEAATNAPVDTGALRNSITSESHMEGDLTFIAQDGVEYGIYQEFGTSRMAAHPFMIPAIEHWAQKFQDAFKVLFP
jgi:HK97 gp10 family phage protein